LTIYERYSKAIIRTSDGDEVTVVDLQCMPDAKADANLIAAAPDLLSACEAFVEAEHIALTDGQGAFSRYVDAIDAAKAAIAKARGKT